MSDADTPPDQDPELDDLPANGKSLLKETTNGLSTPDDESVSKDIDTQPLIADLGLELPDDPAESAEVLIRALLESRREASEHLEMRQRVAADFDNYKKRIERDHRDNLLRASHRVVTSLLPTLDSLDAAIAYGPRSAGEDKILDGMRGTYTQLMDTLAAEGLTPVPATGEPFDPAVHEAVSGPSTEGDGPLVVTKELRRGYLMQGRVVRPSLVVVEHS